MLSWFFKSRIKREIKKEIDYIHHILHDSFGNIKQDITDLHNHHKNKEKKLEEYEQRLISIENHILNQIKTPIKLEIKSEDHMDKLNEVLTLTHQKIFVTLHQLQKSLEGHPISTKSLAKIIYPNKKYSNIRSTISEYLSLLEEIGLISKIRKGKESLAKLTDLGFEYIKKLKEEGKIEKKKLKIKSKH